jgi:hypothetical protein
VSALRVSSYGAFLPGGQATQDLAVCSETLPEAQAVQVGLKAAPEYCMELQREQVLPPPGARQPGPQLEHAMALRRAEIFPAAHAVQTVVPDALWNLPFSQTLQAFLPVLAAKVPGLQSRQAEAWRL